MTAKTKRPGIITLFKGIPFKDYYHNDLYVEARGFTQNSVQGAVALVQRMEFRSFSKPISTQ